MTANPTHRHPANSPVFGFNVWRALLALVLLAIVLGIGAEMVRQTLFAAAPHWLHSDLDENEKLKRIAALTEDQRNAEIRHLSGEVARDPLNADTLYYLAVLHATGKDEAAAARFAELAAKRSLQSSRLQLIGISNHMRLGKYADAAQALDGLMRANLAKREAYFDLANGLLNTDAALPAFAAMLGQDPPWRENYLTALADKKDRQHRLFKLFAEMRKQGAPPKPSELSTLIVALAREGNLDGAYFLWLDSLSPEQMARASLLYDGEFDQPIQNLIFGWNVLKQNNFEASVAQDTVAGGKVLSLSLLTVEDFRNLYQFTRLREGRYTLEGLAKAQGLKTEGHMAWVVSCAESGTVLAELGTLSTDQPWTAFKGEFEVPAQACRYQVLRLEARGAAKVERRVSGQLSFDKLLVKPVLAAPTP